MSRQETDSISPPDTTSQGTEQFSAETIERCAQLLATGETDWPKGLSDEQEVKLLASVRHYRRVRLVRLIASRIAADLASPARDAAKEG